MNDSALSLVSEAISFAAYHHRHQIRKAKSIPYIAHPMRVMTIVAMQFGVTDPDVLSAAVLHDTIEDTNADCDDILENFGPRVASMVAALTKDKRLPEPDRERHYLEGLIAAPVEVKLIKVADTVDNLVDSKLLAPDKRVKPLAKARELAERFAPALTGPRAVALERLRRQIALAENA